MKYLVIIFLFISVQCISQCDVPLLTNTPDLSAVSFESTFMLNRDNMTKWDAGIIRIENQTGRMNYLLGHDSNTANDITYFNSLKNYYDNKYGVIMPFGFAGWGNSIPLGGQLFKTVGIWEKEFFPNALFQVEVGTGLDGGSRTSTATGDQVRFRLLQAIPQARPDNISIFLEKQIGGGDYLWELKSGATILQSGTGTTNYSGTGAKLELITIASVPINTTGILDVDVTVTNQNATGVKSLGFVASTDQLNGIIFHKTARGGWGTQGWWKHVMDNDIYMEQLAALDLDVWQTQLTNDIKWTAQTYVNAMTPILNRISPLYDVLIISGIESASSDVNGGTGLSSVKELSIEHQNFTNAYGEGYLNMNLFYAPLCRIYENHPTYDGAHQTDQSPESVIDYWENAPHNYYLNWSN